MAMLSSTIFSIKTRPSTAMASLTNDSPSSPIPPPTNNKPTKITTTQNQQLRKQRRGKKPSIAQIERAFGSGSYRDAEGDMDMNTVFDELLLGHANKFESKVEKKLREVGEIFVDRTEPKFRSAGKPVLMFTIQWILPIWIMSLLVACGVIKLPFSLPLLDDLLISLVEKKLREVGEIFVDRTEPKFRSAGKPVFMFTIQWILPIWIMSLLVACGVVKLPFSLPLLDDLLM